MVVVVCGTVVVVVCGTVVVVASPTMVLGTVVVVVSPIMGCGTMDVASSPVGDNFKIDETGNWVKSVVVVVSIEEFDGTLSMPALVICVFEIVSRVSAFPQYIKIKNNKKDFFNTFTLFHTTNFT